MEKLNITFLGTGNAIPTEKRNHTGILVSFANENFLFDCGEGIQRQFKIAKISPTKLTKLFITHIHGDHILGIPGLLQTLAMSNYQRTLHIYGPSGTKRALSLIRELLINIRISLEVHEANEEEIINEKDFLVESIPMSHGTPTLAYSLILKDRIRLDKNKLKKFKIQSPHLLKQLANGKDILINNKKIKASQLTYIEKGKKLSIIMDTSFNNNAIKISKNSDLLICESTFSSKEKEKAEEYKHLTASQAATIAKSSKVKSLVLTHISQRYEHNTSKIEKEAKEVFKNTKIVKDFDVVTI